MGWLMWCYQLVCLQLVLLHSLSFANLCSHQQTSALLQFKQLFSFNEDPFSNYFDQYYCDRQLHYPKMKYWKEDTDCCLWDGITCDMVTGHVISVDLSCSWLQGNIPSNTSLFLLSHLQNLNLAFNDFNLSQIPPDFVKFPSLTHLNLSSSYFSGQVPSEISYLAELVSLDLSSNIDLTLETLVLKGLVQNLTELEELVLDRVNMSTVAPSYLTNISSSLTLFSLSNCELGGSFPENIFHLPNLHTLDLNNNYDLTGAFPKDNWTTPLMFLAVAITKFSGELPNSIGNLNSLLYLNLEYCHFIGSVPASIGNLTHLSYLILDHNNFSGHIPSSLSNLEQLVKLSLPQNNFQGEIPDIFNNLTKLLDLDFSINRLSGPIPSIAAGGLRNLAFQGNSLNGAIPFGYFALLSLEMIDLSNNQPTGQIDKFHSDLLQSIDLSNNRLYGPIPSSIFELVNLTSLLLSSNNLSGSLDLNMFLKLKNLERMYLSYNNLSFMSTTIKVNSSFTQLNRLGLSSCNIKEFPEILSTANNLQTLDLSNNKIHGKIPNWLFNIGLLYLNLSKNLLTGIERLPWESLKFLDLHSNLLQGLLPAPPPFIQFFSVSNNRLTGAIPSSFCSLDSYIEYIDLSNNSLYGRVPQCLGNYTTILVLDLRMNHFHGSFPQTFANGSQLTTLNLNGNRLEGPLPPSLVNCGNLEVLDVGNNMINDTFPHWLATLPKLKVLILRYNRFYGPLGNSRTSLPFSKLRILDLSYNGFTGLLQSRFFENLQAMMSGKNNSAQMRYMGDNYYQDSVMVTMKGVEIELERILTIFTTMDLSNNKFQGQIPNVVGKLTSLKVLNISYNNLIGHIPLSLENLTELESLDLSSNKLDGKIPQQLTSLTFLSVLNLSYNQLVGSIPKGSQFDTFQNNSYIGNLGLCGIPLSKTCSNDKAPESEPTRFPEEHDTWSWFDWKIILMGYGSGLVIGLSMGYIVFSTGKPWWFVSMVERKVIKLIGNRRRRRRN